jgi:alginate O-acetyltransferase complex protein AlgI
MQFNSWEYIIFFSAIYFLYWLIKDYKLQNRLLLVASYYFYASWDVRFLILIVVSTIVDFICGQKIYECSIPKRKKRWLLLSITTNLGILGFFKYFDFFITSLEPMLSAFGLTATNLRLHIVLPVGISFYTFQTMSYTIDIYRGQLRPTRRFFDFALFVAFFPQLVAGPIERASNLLPQILKPRKLNHERFTTGIWLILWGLWKKIVIADNMAIIADKIFLNTAEETVLMIYLGIVAFAWQVYCDFSAYSDIARGTGRLLGFDLMLNFNLPYFAVNPSDLWRRWHISLSTWLRDYLYRPLGGNRGSWFRKGFNAFFTMALCGLWHGAGWNFVGWGVFNGIGLVLHGILFGTAEKKQFKNFNWQWLISVIGTFHFFIAGLLIFRCSRKVIVGQRYVNDSLAQIIEVFTSYRNGWGLDVVSFDVLLKMSYFLVPILLIQWFQYWKKDHLYMIQLKKPIRVVFVSALIFSWILHGIQGGEAFIYFQF